MTDKELIAIIKELRQIKPKKEWVVLTKKELFQEESLSFKERLSMVFGAFPRVAPAYKFAVVTFIFFCILFAGTFLFVQKALPGDLLFSLKRISEKSQVLFTSEADKPKMQLEIANKRLEELTRIAEANQTQRLAPAIKEFQASASQAAENINNIKGPQKITKEIVLQTKKLEESREKIEALGVVVGETTELENALSQLVESQIKDLESRTLTEEQLEVLNAAKQDYEAKNYSQALEKILILNQ